MKEIRQKKDKGVSAIIATILLIAITVVLAATLVTILGGFTHGVSNSVVSVGATTQETSSAGGHDFTVFFNVSSSSSSISTSKVTISINGVSNETLAAFISGNSAPITASGSSPITYNALYGNATGPSTITGGSSFSFSSHNKVTSFELIYDGNVIYKSGSISVIS